MGKNWYERHVLPWLVDFACSRRPFRRQRQRVVPLAAGRVLEIGIGTGLNLEHYDWARIGQIVGLDPGLEMHPRARRRSQRLGVAIELIGLSAERLPFDDSSFDTVVVTYTLCSIADPATALKEMRRVLKPGGRLVFCEHGLAPDESVRRWQARLTPLWSKVAGGCHLDRDVPRLLREAGFRLDDMHQTYLPGPRAASYNYWGTAMRADGTNSSAACSKSR